MIHLLESPNPENKDKQPYPRRQLSKTTTRLIAIAILGFICYFVGRKLHWSSLSDNFDTKDAAIIQYFCNQQSSDASKGGNTRWEQQIKDIDHKRPSHLKPEFLPDQVIPQEIWDNLPVKGAYYMIVRNEKSNDARAVIASMEMHMKNGTQYPWIILNNQHFSADFRKYVKRVIKAPVFFGKIDLEAWEYPYWVDAARAEEIISDQEYGDDQRTAKLSYHQLLRYHSGLFFHHPLFKDIEYSWRVEPGADYSCNMDKDMFMVMKENNKKLGFVITMKESPLHVPSLWKRVNEFRTIYPEYVLDENATIYPWIYNEKEESYNYCHFWSNFQIVDLSFFRSEAYQKYFEHLDKTGNFFYERWGDAPVQTIAAALFLKKEEIHFFNEIGYTHSIATHCPYSESLLRDCSCDVRVNYDLYQDSCLKKLLKIIDPPLLNSMKTFMTAKNIEPPAILP